MALVAVLRVLLRLDDEPGERAEAVLRRELVDVDAGRDLVHAVDVADDVLEHRTDVRRADEDRIRPGERLRTPLFEIGPPAHRVLELRPVRLHGVAPAGRSRYRPAHEHVVGEDEIGRQELAQRRRIRIDVARTLGRREVLQELRLEPFVPVEHEHRQQPVRELGDDDARAAEVVALRVPLLADDRDVVARVAPFAGECPRVDVRSGTSEEVPVPDEDVQVRWKYSA